MSSSLDSDRFRRACARFATGVAVATTADADGTPHGLTVNSFTSVSLAPPMILVCIDRASFLHVKFSGCQRFAINVLTSDQEEYCSRFARRWEDRFQNIAWRAGRDGVPLFPDALAYFECAVERIVEAGDHTILIGNVLDAWYREGDPLIYFDSRCRPLKT